MAKTGEWETVNPTGSRKSTDEGEWETVNSPAAFVPGDYSMGDDDYGPWRARIQGATFGLGDDIYGTVRGLFADDAMEAEAKEQGLSATQLGRLQEHQKILAFQKKYPMKALGEEVLGSVAMPGIGQAALAYKWLPKLMTPAVKTLDTAIRANPVAATTVIGGLSGAGHSAPGGENLVADTATGAAVGLGSGGVLKLIGAGLPIAGEFASSLVAPSKMAKSTGGRHGRNAVRAALKNDDVTDINQRIEAMIRSGKPVTLADTNPNTLGLLDTMKNHPGPARNKVTQYLNTRDKMGLNRLNKDVDSVVGGGSFYKTMKALTNKRKQQANVHYAKAYEKQIPVSEELVSILKTPAGQDALAKSYKLAGNELIDLPKIKFSNGRLETEAGDIVTGIDTRMLDFIKKSLDDEIGAMLNHASGQSGSSLVRGVIDRKNQLIKLMDDANPDYKTARNLFAGDKAVTDAMENGRKILHDEFPEHIADMVKAMSESEKVAYRMGAMSAVRDGFGGAVEGATATNMAGNKAYNFLKNNKGVRSLRHTFPGTKSGSKQYREFLKNLGDEMEMKRTNATVMGGSPTASRIANERNLLDTVQPSWLSQFRENVNPGWRQGAKDVEMSEIAKLLTTDPMGLNPANLGKLIPNPKALRDVGKTLMGVEGGTWMDPVGRALKPLGVGAAGNLSGGLLPTTR